MIASPATAAPVDERGAAVSVRAATTIMILAALFFGVMALVAKGAAARVPGPEVAFVRFAVGLAGVLVAMTRTRLAPRNWRGLFWRGAFGGTAVLLYFLVIEHLPVGTATLLNYTAPVFAALFAWLALGETMGAAAVAALATTLAGVAVVIAAAAPAGAVGTLARVVLGRWQLVGVASAVFSGAAIATIRQVRRTDGSWEIFAAFCVGGLVCTGVPALRGWVAPDAYGWAMLVAVGVLALVAQLMMTWSLRYLPAATVGILLQLTPVSTIGLGRVVFGERPVGLALVGAAVTVAGVCWGAWLAQRPPARH